MTVTPPASLVPPPRPGAPTIVPAAPPALAPAANAPLDQQQVDALLAEHDADTAALRENVARARATFTELGIRPEEGNGPVSLVLRPESIEASYTAKVLTKPDGSVVRTDERVEVGKNPYTGTSWGRAPDVIAHELAHRVVEHIQPTFGTTPMSRIVDESIADTLAAVVDGNWTMGESIVPGGLRSMSEPGKQRTVRDGVVAWEPVASRMEELTPQHMQLGPYPSIGPLNNAAYRIGTALGPRPMAQIYLEALRNHLKPESGPTDLVVGTIRAARELHGAESRELQAVRDAWKGVGVRAAAVDSV